MEVEVIEENIEELITTLASHTHSTEWDIGFLEQVVKELQTNLKRLRRMRG